jgi:hypothetical protein
LQPALGLRARETCPRARLSLETDLASQAPTTDAPLSVPALSPSGVFADGQRSGPIASASAVRSLARSDAGALSALAGSSQTAGDHLTAREARPLDAGRDAPSELPERPAAQLSQSAAEPQPFKVGIREGQVSDLCDPFTLCSHGASR